MKVIDIYIVMETFLFYCRRRFVFIYIKKHRSAWHTGSYLHLGNYQKYDIRSNLQSEGTGENTDGMQKSEGGEGGVTNIRLCVFELFALDNGPLRSNKLSIDSFIELLKQNAILFANHSTSVSNICHKANPCRGTFYGNQVEIHMKLPTQKLHLLAHCKQLQNIFRTENVGVRWITKTQTHLGVCI